MLNKGANDHESIKTKAQTFMVRIFKFYLIMNNHKVHMGFNLSISKINLRLSDLFEDHLFVDFRPLYHLKLEAEYN